MFAPILHWRKGLLSRYAVIDESFHAGTRYLLMKGLRRFSTQQNMISSASNAILDLNLISIFDTMHAARILGRKNVGLASILESEFQINLQKKYQRANWGKRPLMPEMLNYARLDSYFLIPLRNRLKAELVETGLLTTCRRRFQTVNGWSSSQWGKWWKQLLEGGRQPAA